MFLFMLRSLRLLLSLDISWDKTNGDSTSTGIGFLKGIKITLLVKILNVMVVTVQRASQIIHFSYNFYFRLKSETCEMHFARLFLVGDF